VLALAATTHHLRNTRERELAAAAARLEQGDYAGALSLLDRAERWPSTARPGRIDDLRGQAWEGLGERTRAEASYLRAYRADPGYFWLVVDLAAFYASSDEPRNERRRRVSPLVQRLREEFANEPAMPAAVDRILRKLGSGT
jgi:tetratricopeptide (TPR) repeat protein